MSNGPVLVARLVFANAKQLDFTGAYEKLAHGAPTALKWRFDELGGDQGSPDVTNGLLGWVGFLFLRAM